ncbi:MAG: hypothetical protein RBS13_02120 [Bacteroidales bacterium]|nr:hypothetical protein [Bacteroidales bacterium]
MRLTETILSTLTRLYFKYPYVLFTHGNLTFISPMFIFFPMGSVVCDLRKVGSIPWARYQGDVGQGRLGTLGKVPR